MFRVALRIGFLTTCRFAPSQIDASTTPKIIGGSDAPDDRYPYMVSLQDPYSFETHICGGSLIAPDIVLSGVFVFHSLVWPIKCLLTHFHFIQPAIALAPFVS